MPEKKEPTEGGLSLSPLDEEDVFLGLLLVRRITGRLVAVVTRAKHIADALQARLADNVELSLVMDNATRVTSEGVKPGDFNRKTTFAKWARDFDFDRVRAEALP